jgi:hypothetical protein
MALNPGIINSIRPMELESPLNAFSKFVQVKGMMDENAASQLKAQEAAAGKQQNMMLNRVYADSLDPNTGRIDPAKLTAGLAAAGMGSKIPGVEKEVVASEEARAKAARESALAVGERMKASRMLLEGVSQPEQYIAWHEANHTDPVLGPFLASRGVTAEQSRAKIMAALQQPGGFEKLLQESKLGAEKTLERYFVDQNLGDEVRLISTPKYGVGPATEIQGSRARVKMSPYQGATINMGGGPAPTITEVVDPTNPGKMLRVDARVYRGGGPGSPGVVGESGKEPIVGVDLPQKEIQAREKAFPRAQAAFKSVEGKMGEMERDLRTLATHPGLTGVTGLVYGRTPGITREARAAEALLKKIMARGGFQELADMRAASPTGGALGNVTNQENQYLRDAFGALSPTQATEDFQANLLRLADAIPGAKQRVKEAFDMTYEYRNSGVAGPARGNAPPAPGRPKSSEVDANNPLLR